MAREHHKLTALFVQRAKLGKTYADGGNLYLQVNSTGGKYWIYRYMADGVANTMSIGPARLISLSEAREEAVSLSRMRLKGLDPKDSRAKAVAAPGPIVPTFRAMAEEYISAHAPGWRSAKHADQWRSTLAAHVFGSFGDLPVDQIGVTEVIAVLKPIWSTKTTTADRIRQRIEAILDSAKALGYRKDENPARWKGGLKSLLPPKSRVQKTRHFSALHYRDLPKFMLRLSSVSGYSSLALQFLVLTATRTSETLLARWDEIDLKHKTWTIPAKRTKTNQDHVVPLSARAMAILKRTPRMSGNPFVFPGRRKGKPLSNMALLTLRNRLQMPHITVHGFRSTFRDWAAANNYPRELAEMALSHAVGSKVEAAYLRDRLVENRREMMTVWSNFASK
jgi:integrase